MYLVPVDNDFRKVQPRIVTRLKQAGFTVTEMKPDSAPVQSQGSGFIVGKEGRLLTCAHVVQGDTNVTAWIEGGRHVGHVVASDTNLDLALVSLEEIPSGYQPVYFRMKLIITWRRSVHTMGFPLAEVLGTQPRLGKGLISSTFGMGDNPRELQVSVETQPANSGGPLLNKQGEAVGVMSGTLNPLNVLVRTGGNLPQNVNFAINNAPIQAFLAKNGISPSTRSGDSTQGNFEDTKRSRFSARRNC
jgi:serine protease Do